MPAPAKPYQPYASVHEKTNGPGDARPTAIQIVKDLNKVGALKGKTAIITGCSAGIGVETARALYEAGASLFLQARDIPKLENLIDDIVTKADVKDVPRPQALEIHLDDLSSVRAGVETFKAKSNGQLSLLINNAGVMAAPYGKTKDGFETQIGVNHFAHFLLFQLVKPLLLSTAKATGTTSRLINLSSAGHRRTPVVFSNKSELDAWNAGEGYDKWLAYGNSKTANIWMANSVSRHYAAQGLIGLSVHPGGITTTSLNRHMTDEDYKFLSLDSWKHSFKSAEQGAATTVWAALTDHYEGKEGGVYLNDVGEAGAMEATKSPGSPGYVPHAYDEAKEEGLWKLSYQALGLKED